MGSSNSVKLWPSDLQSFKLATIRKVNDPEAAPYDLYLSHTNKADFKDGHEGYSQIFTLPKDIYIPDAKEIEMPCDLLIDFENFIAVSKP